MLEIGDVALSQNGTARFARDRRVRLLEQGEKGLTERTAGNISRDG
jgi:hypothetical protein